MAGVLQHLRSSTLNKRPNPASMVDGQVAINYASGSPGMFFKDSNGSLVKVGPVHVGSGAPNAVPASGGTAGNSIGEQWLDTSGGTYVFKIWDGAAWRSEAGEFVNATGDTMTGDLVMNNANVVFEGSVDDGFETTLTVVNPTADRTITLPNVTGTVVTTGDSGTVTSTMIADGTIVNADVNASAAIAGTKISPDFGSQTIQTTGIVSHALGSASAPTVTFTGDTNTGIYSPGADQVAISTNGTGRLFVDASGNVGVATSPSAWSAFTVLQIQKGSIASSGDDLNLMANAYYDGSDYRRIGTQGVARQYFNTDGSFIWSRAGTGTANSTVTFSEVMRLDSSGRLGLGTSSPNYQLHVTTDFAVGASGFNQQLTFSNDTIQSLLLGTGYTALKLNPLGGNVGIGVASPGQLITAQSSASGTAPTFKLQNPVDSNSSQGAANNLSAGELLFGATGAYPLTAKIESVYDSDASFGRSASLRFSGANGSGTLSERMRIDASGNVGIGTTAAPAGGSIKTVIDGSSGGGLELVFNNNGGGALIPSSGGGLQFYTHTGAVGSESYSERARIDSSGRLLVGTSSALTNGDTFKSKLVVNGDTDGPGYPARLTLNNSVATVLTDYKLAEINFAGQAAGNPAASITCYAESDWNTAGDTTDNPGRLVFSTTADGASSPTERMRITSTGQTYWSSASPSASSFGTSIGRVGQEGLFENFRNQNGTQEAAVIGGSAGYARIMGDGDLENTNNAYGAISDVKLKENIVDASSQWDDLKALRVRKYNFKTETGYNTHTQIGLVAQEVELVSPGLVSEYPDRDTEGNDLGTLTKSVNYSVLYMKAVKALQEAMERIEQLETEMAEVKAQLQTP